MAAFKKSSYAIDYLLKPIAYEDFLKAANKALRKISQNSFIEKDNVKSGEYFFVKSDGRQLRITFEDIAYIESLSEYVKICMTNQESIVTLMSLKALEDILPKNKFMRVHRSFIVNLHKITTVERNRIIFNKKYIPVSDQYKDRFKKFIDNTFL